MPDVAERQDFDLCLAIMQMRSYEELSRRAEQGQLSPQEWKILEEFERDSGGITEHERKSAEAAVGAALAKYGDTGQ